MNGRVEIVAEVKPHGVQVGAFRLEPKTWSSMTVRGRFVFPAAEKLVIICGAPTLGIVSFEN